MYARLVFLQDLDDFVNDVYRYEDVGAVLDLTTLVMNCISTYTALKF